MIHARHRWLQLPFVSVLASLMLSAAFALPLRAQNLLIPMDDGQRNHLKAYGVAYLALKTGQKAEWLLNYRGGAFLLPDAPDLRRRAALDGVSVETVGDASVAAIRAEIAGANMDAVVLERAPRIAIYRPANQPPWDDAVTLALTYAGIDFTSVWDDDVLKGDLSLVGPRPHALQAKAANTLYDQVVDGYFARHKVKPGITGWAQINGWRGETDTSEKIERRVEHDLYYIENWSILLDLKILVKTPLALLNTKNAY